MAAARTKVLFLIPSLVAHGAERQLCELVKAMDKTRFEVHVAVFYDPEDCEGGDLTPELREAPGVTLHSLHKRRGPTGYAGAFLRLLSLLWTLEPRLVHGYMDGNFPSLLAGKLLGAKVVWGIRRTSADRGTLHRGAHLWTALNARLSILVDLILFNSEAGLKNHRTMGFRPQADGVVPNGFDVARFAPNPELGQAQREAWGVDPAAPLIGIVGRFAPVKDHETFLRAAARIASRMPQAHFVIVGEGDSARAAQLGALAEELGLGARLHWAGFSARMPAVYNALSLLLLSSVDEGFPNVLGEAMACGVPCVSTHVGDAALLVGDTGRVVGAGDAEAMAVASLDLLGEGATTRTRREEAARARIVAGFSTEALARRTEGALGDLLRGTA